MRPEDVNVLDGVVLVDGPSFCVSRPSGDLAGGADGLYVGGRRILSRCLLQVAGRATQPVDGQVDDPGAATFVARARPASAGGGPVVIRRRRLGDGLRDHVEIRNTGGEATYVEVAIDLGADAAEASVIRAGGMGAEPIDPEIVGGDIVFARGRGPGRTGCRVVASDGASVEVVETGSAPVGALLRWEAIVPARSSRSFGMVAIPIVAGAELEPRQPLGSPLQRSESAARLERWHREVPDVDTSHHALALAVRRSARDLGSLRVIDPDFPERAVVAAAAPWFLALHARDALLAAWMSLVADPDLALGTVETLARFQGAEIDDRTEEQPGRIVHRLGLGPGGFGGPGSGPISYGSVDATPLFVMLLGELRRWGLAPEVVDRLLPHADRALEWITTFGDRDGDGYVEYERATDAGQRHQGWRDSENAIRFPDGRPAHGPIATAEVQAYVYAAFRARAHFAAEAGDDVTGEHWRQRARELQARFNRDFWLDEHGWVASALDADKRPVPALTSSMGHCLWTGILDEAKAAVVAKHLVANDLFSGWGVRTLAASMGGHDAVSLHGGAVWPHDNAVCVAGLVRYGRVDEAQHLLLAQLEAAAADGGRLSVLCGFDRDDVPTPVRYPDGCTSRAWSAAAALGFLRALLRFDPWVPQGKLWLAPALPPAIRRLRVERIPLLRGRVTVTVEGDRAEVEGLPPGVELVTGPRPPRAPAL